MASTAAASGRPQVVGSVADLLALHGSWDQPVKVTMPGRGGVSMLLTQGCSLPVVLYDYEVMACVHDASEQSGLKWWLRHLKRSVAKQKYAEYSWGKLEFVCPHYRKAYVKQIKDGSRDAQHRSCLGCEANIVIKGATFSKMQNNTCAKFHSSTSRNKSKLHRHASLVIAPKVIDAPMQL